MDYPQLKRTEYPDSTVTTRTDQAHFHDFRDYHLPLVRLHHAYLTRGIARGLEVQGTLGGTTITVEPGVAVDGQGQLLVLTSAAPRSTLTFLNRTLYVTLQFAEGRGPDGRLEQVPAEQVRLRDAPTLDSGSDEAVVVLALVKTDGNGRVTALQVQDGERRFRRQLLGEQVEALELQRAVREGDRLVTVPAGKLAAGEQGGLRLTVPGAADAILVAREDGGEFQKVEIRADVQVSGTIAGTLAAGAITSVHLAEADGTSGQETNIGSGVKTGHLQDQAVTAAKLQDQAVTAAKLQDQAVTAAKLQAHATDNAQRAVGRTHLQDQAVTTAKLQDQAVTAAKLQAHPSDSTQRAVGPAHLQENVVGPDHLRHDVISQAHLQDNAVTAAKIAEADGTSGQETNIGSGVKTGHLQDQAVTAAKLQDQAVMTAKLQDQAVTAAKLQAHATDNAQRAVGRTHLQDQAVTTAKLQDQAVTAAKLQAHPSDSTQRAVGPTHLQENAVGLTHLQENTVGPTHLQENAVGPTHLRANAVTAAKLQAHATDNTQRAVGPTHLQDQAVGSTHLQANAVGPAQLADGAVVSAKIADQAVTLNKIAPGVLQDIGIGITVMQTIQHGQTIPIPRGFQKSECVFFVALKFLNMDPDLGRQVLSCNVDSDGKVSTSDPGRVLAMGVALTKKGGW